MDVAGRIDWGGHRNKSGLTEMRVISLFLLALAAPGAADDWQSMSGDQIRHALNGAHLEYESATQFFMTDGRTEYVAGRPSLGLWEVRGDQYCSV